MPKRRTNPKPRPVILQAPPRRMKLAPFVAVALFAVATILIVFIVDGMQGRDPLAALDRYDLSSPEAAAESHRRMMIRGDQEAMTALHTAMVRDRSSNYLQDARIVHRLNLGDRVVLCASFGEERTVEAFRVADGKWIPTSVDLYLMTKDDPNRVAIETFKRGGLLK